jgi:CspA family cold shock protein
MRAAVPRERGVAMAERVEGVVNWFRPDIGYGFIEQENGPDVFVHRSALGEDVYTLEPGDRVEFSIEQDSKGSRAAEVDILSSAAE